MNALPGLRTALIGICSTFHFIFVCSFLYSYCKQVLEHICTRVGYQNSSVQMKGKENNASSKPKSQPSNRLRLVMSPIRVLLTISPPRNTDSRRTTPSTIQVAYAMEHSKRTFVGLVTPDKYRNALERVLIPALGQDHERNVSGKLPTRSAICGTRMVHKKQQKRWSAHYEVDRYGTVLIRVLVGVNGRSFCTHTVQFLCVLAAILLVLAVAYLCIVTRTNSQAAKIGLFVRFLAIIAVLFAAIGAYGTIFQAYVAWVDRR